ncbi:MAG: hypothetical protein R6U27_11315 [Desulfobacterales bacterium]
MPAYELEEIIIEGKLEIKELFQYVENNSQDLDAYQMETGIRKLLNKIGLSAMKAYFAQRYRRCR